MGDRKMALLHRVRHVLGIAPSHRRPCWWPAGLLALAVPLAIWLTSLSPSPSGVAEAQAAEKGGDAPATPAAENRIQPLDLLTIRVLGTMLDQPIDGFYLVEPSGQVALGPAYGRVEVKGLTIEQAESAIRKKLEEVLSKPDVQVTAAGRVAKWRLGKPPKTPYRISPNDMLTIRVLGTMLDQPIDGPFVVEPGGTVPLGPGYGRAKIVGMTPEEAGIAIRKQLEKVLAKPDVLVTLGGWQADSQQAATDLEHTLRKAKAELATIGRMQDDIRRMRNELERLRSELNSKLRKPPPAPKSAVRPLPGQGPTSAVRSDVPKKQQ
jgi:protein involved in polysaccharide export with SLBB domain